MLFFRLRKCSIPIDVSLTRRKKASLQQSFQLVFKADFFVGARPCTKTLQSKTKRRRRQMSQPLGKAVGAIGKIAAEDFIGAFTAERNSAMRPAKLREKPDGQCT